MRLIHLFAVCLAASTFSIVFTRILLPIARRYRIVDRPNTRKVHRKPIPRVGGIAIAAGTFLAGCLGLALYSAEVADAIARELVPVVGILFGGFAVLLVGFVDDVRGIPASLKLAGQAFAGIVVVMCNIQIDGVTIGADITINFGLFALPLTLLWIVGVTNAINLIDGLDGLASGVTAIVCMAVLTLSIASGDVIVSLIGVALLGSLLGFLTLNFHPARVFMGDGGSNFIGFILATLVVLALRGTPSIGEIAFPALALGMPILDTAFSIARRALDRRSLFAPDRSHIHHRLLIRGLTHRQAVLSLYGLTTVAALLGLAVARVNHVVGLAISVVGVVVLMLAFRWVGAIRLRETWEQLQHNRAIGRATLQQKHQFEQLQLRMRDASTFDEWWSVIRHTANELGLTKITLRVDNRDSTVNKLIWSRGPSSRNGGSTLVVSLPVRQRRAGRSMEAEIHVPISDSLEVASHSIVLLGRLIDERSVADLTPALRRAAPRPQAAPSIHLIAADDDTEMPAAGRLVGSTKRPYIKHAGLQEAHQKSLS